MLEQFLTGARLHSESVLIEIIGGDKLTMATNIALLQCESSKKNVRFNYGKDNCKHLIVSIDNSFNGYIEVYLTFSSNDLNYLYKNNILKEGNIVIHYPFNEHSEYSKLLENFLRVMVRKLSFDFILLAGSTVFIFNMVDLRLRFIRFEGKTIKVEILKGNGRNMINVIENIKRYELYEIMKLLFDHVEKNVIKHE